MTAAALLTDPPPAVAWLAMVLMIYACWRLMAGIAAAANRRDAQRHAAMTEAEILEEWDARQW